MPDQNSSPSPAPAGQSWWTTLPGVLAAVAGLITAIAGLLKLFMPPDPPPKPLPSPVTQATSAPRFACANKDFLTFAVPIRTHGFNSARSYASHIAPTVLSSDPPSCNDALMLANQLIELAGKLSDYEKQEIGGNPNAFDVGILEEMRTAQNRLKQLLQ